MLEIINAKKKFGEKTVLDNVNISLSSRESLVILGKSGEGKSVLFKTILGLINLDEGDIQVSGISVNDYSLKSDYIEKFSMLFQNSALFDSKTILENISFKLIENGVKADEARLMTEKSLMKVGLDKSILNLYPSELSGGMQKRVALARAIVTKPQIILFDEPTSGLDPVTGAMIIKLIKQITTDLHISSITITHDISAAKYIADKVAILKSGKIFWYGNVDEFFSSDDQFVKEFISASNL